MTIASMKGIFNLIEYPSIEQFEFIRETLFNKKLLIFVPTGPSYDCLVSLTYRVCQLAAVFICYLSENERDEYNEACPSWG